MKISIVTIAYNLPDSTRKLFQTAMLDSDKHDIDFWLYLHSSHEATVEACEEMSATYPTSYFPYGTNRGLSTSWNEGIHDAYEAGADVVIVSNDDIFFRAGDIDKIARKSYANRDNYVVSCAGYHLGFDGRWQATHGYSCFAINPISLEIVGCFDENIFPIYMEDCEHHYRATILGLVEENCADTHVTHAGSSAINKDDRLAIQNLITQPKNGIYYRSKWGGINGYEIYKHPFDNPGFSPYIPYERRHAPYGPGYDRTDQYIVSI